MNNNCIHKFSGSKRKYFASTLAAFLFAMVSTATGQNGHVMSGVGAVDQAMSGAGSVSLPLDGVSALYANPAGIAGMEGMMLDVSLQIMEPSGTLYSSIQQDAFGPNFPSTTMVGSTESKAGPFPIPAVGFVYAPSTSRWSFGFSAFGVGGFGVDYELTPTNPITTPQAPNGFGFGAIPSEFQLLQISPTVAYKITDKFAIGVSPILNRSSLKVNPFPAAPPDDGNNDGFYSYPDGPQTSAWGTGYAVGFILRDLSNFHFGFSYKSVQKFEDLEFTSTDEVGNPRNFTFNLDYPSIVTAGISYTGIDRLLLAADVRYIDFGNTDGFDKSGYDQTGAVKGFGWKSIFVYSAGLQYELTDRLPVRFGYSYNPCPMDHEDSFFNVSAPAIIEHHLSTGLSYGITGRLKLNLAFQYGLKNSTEGQWVSPLGEMPGTMVRNELSTKLFIAGVNIGL